MLMLYTSIWLTFTHKEVEELISPPSNTRMATKFRKNPSFSSPPRPPNRFLLFRRDFFAKMKQQGMKMTHAKVSRLTSEEWKKQPAEVLRYFEILEQLAKDKHKEIYPAYRYSPKPKKKLAKL
ncbi:specific transcriptional repressor [Gigaspora margarita]|uniref:Specific transcriptional repressor n=1 Tax=Gigaspora margarita TaxID=4874 RepID=A0A8H4AKR8_GIGMA|nr:specific transcriptional repressor [Gigaspora margarita]